MPSMAWRMGILVGVGMVLVYIYKRKGRDIKQSGTELIGNTPIIKLQYLSEMTGCTILGKAEFMNIGGSSKDRVALSIIENAERDGLLQRGGTVYEGTVGSTGISLAMVCKAKGYQCHIVMPSDVAIEKSNILKSLGAVVERVPPVGIVHPDHFVNIAKRRANETGGFYCDQFENVDNFKAHFETTGPEIFEQIGTFDAFVMGAGTGGTIAGIARYLKPKIPKLKVVLADPEGSGLYNKIKYGLLYTSQEAEGTRKRHQVDTIVEGIGLNRLTKNFQLGIDFIDDAIKVTDQEAINMSRLLMDKEGLFVGSSSSVNCVAAYQLAKKLGPGHTILTILCDSGTRHLTKFWSPEYLLSMGYDLPT